MSDDPLQTVTRAGAKLIAQHDQRARLRAVHPTELAWSLPVGPHATIVGRTRSPEVERPLVHGTVSRRHFELRWDPKARQHVGRDLDSHNGSRLDGRALGSEVMPLHDGSVLQLGDVLLVYERLGLEAPHEDEPDDEADDLATAIPGRCPAMQVLRQRLRRAAPDPSPVLLLGETGTGKEHIARQLHQRSGRPGPLVSINCSALSPQLIDSQLFGHVKGAFTGATTDQPGLLRAADGGTLFLDEIGDMPLPLQPKLLRALQEGEVQPVGSAKLVSVDVRVIAATHHELVSRVEAGEFRRDLYARLAMWELHVPALRERRGDLLTWLDRLHAAWLHERPGHPAEPLTLSPEAAERLLLHDWPSNLRELERLVHELASAPSLPRPIAPQWLPAWVSALPAHGASAPTAEPAAGREATARPPVPTREQFVTVFEQLQGNVRAMAKHFGRDRRQIYRWIEAHGLAARRHED